MKRILSLLILCFIFSITGCFDDNKVEGKGTLVVTVNTEATVWSFPQVDSLSTTRYLAYDGDTLYKWQYLLVGGDSTALSSPNSTTNIYNADSTKMKVGTKINAVYLYSAIELDSGNMYVLYSAKSSTNNSQIVISNIKPGSYYIVAFYDYCKGGNVDNLMNRYDRYAIYTDTANAYAGTDNSTPFYDKAQAVIIGEDAPATITLDIKQNWVMGKPKTDSTIENGRYFLTSTDTMPTP